VSGPAARVEVRDQYTDFLVRADDPYAMAKYAIALAWLGEVRGQRALVVGSGSGELACFLAARGAEVLAIDIDEPSIALTRATAARLGVSLRTGVSTVEAFEPAGPFDLVVATDVIEHVAGDVAAVGKMKAWLVPGGRLLLTVPALPWLFGYHDEILGHHRRYSKRSLLDVVEAGGAVRVREVRYFGFFLVPVALLVSRLLRRAYPVARAGAETRKATSLTGLVLRALLGLERRVAFPAGTSLLLLAEK
jgi:2-polyprenyl-3-methyl-5-hydroxy-6-metoxy-1,4-benzoquinol methylase